MGKGANEEINPPQAAPRGRQPEAEAEKRKPQPSEKTLRYLLEVRPIHGRDYLVVWKKPKPDWGENQIWEHLTALPIAGSLPDYLAAGGNLAAADARAEELEEILLEIEPPVED